MARGAKDEKETNPPDCSDAGTANISPYLSISDWVTQAKLAEELYISRTTFSGFESEKPINSNMIVKICAALHTDPNHLYGVEGATGMDKEELLKAAIKAAEEMYKELYQ